jgi:hypothetical protein
MIPKGVSAQTLYVDLKLESFMVSAQAQQYRLTSGVLTIFGAMADPGGPPVALTAAMTVFSMAVALVGLTISPRFSNPAQALSGTAHGAA